MKSPSKPSIYIAVPNGNGWIHKDVHYVLLQMLCDRRYKTSHDLPTNKPYVHNLHTIVQAFLKTPYEYLLLIDADNPPMRNPLELTKYDYDVIGLPTLLNAETAPSGCRPYLYNVVEEVEGGFKPVDNHSKMEGIEEVDAVGTGCILIARRVLKKIKAPFMREWSEDGLAIKGNDFAFCQRARKAGFKIHVAWDYRCKHYKQINLELFLQKLGASVASASENV